MFSVTPYKRTYSLFDDFERFFDSDLWSKNRAPSAAACRANNWVPAVDVEEEENRFLVKADLPGVEPSDVEITVENGLLSIKGERNEEKEESKEGYRRTERVYGSFSRSFRLPDEVNTEAITAKGKNGLLEIEIPKTEKRKPKRIKIQ